MKNIVILGGGTAGWMTANLLQKKWRQRGIQISVVESPDIGIIGVGEGSTPLLKEFFDSLEISESEWMPQCNATYKNGISFNDWSTVPGYESYFHPFPCSLDFATFGFLYKYTELRRKGADVLAHPNRFSLMAGLTERKLAPLPAENFPFHFQYGYHFDSVLIGKFLREKAKESGVCHIEATVEKVEQESDGSIKSLLLNTGQILSGDFFVDCSGFASILLQKTLKVPFVSFAENLFNDSAVAIPTDIETEIPAETLSTALSNGWAWKIPLTNRFGNGYVFSSKYCSSDEAETELRTHLNILESDVEARHLKMKVGRVQETWAKNCVAVGLSQGFIEPLEATALQFVYSTIEQFSQALEEGNFSGKNRDEFNARMNANFEGVRDYIVLHYKTNSRSDSQYWIDNRENQKISDNLRAMIECWYAIEDTQEALTRLNIGNYYSQRSWTCLLAGVGVFPKQENLVIPDKEKVGMAMKDLKYVDDFIKGCSLNFKSHGKLLSKQV